MCVSLSQICIFFSVVLRILGFSFFLFGLVLVADVHEEDIGCFIACVVEHVLLCPLASGTVGECKLSDHSSDLYTHPNPPLR